MIATLRGTLLEAKPLSAVVECGGVGYRVNVPVTTAEALPPCGQEVFLHIYPVYREDDHQLYGFRSRRDRDLFALVTEKVNGVGPRLALSVMSRLSVDTLVQAVVEGNVTLLSKCPGIGKKTAERICLDLRDHVGVLADATLVAHGGQPVERTGSLAAQPSASNDAVQALVALGIKLDKADAAVRAARQRLGADATTEVLIREALR